MQVERMLYRDLYRYGGYRYLVTDTPEEFSIQRIDPNSIIEIYEEY